MRKLWQDEAWEEYLYWQTQDKKTLKENQQAFDRYRPTRKRNPSQSTPAKPEAETCEDYRAFKLTRKQDSI